MSGRLAVAERGGHAHPEHGGIGPGRFVGVAPALGPLDAYGRIVSGEIGQAPLLHFAVEGIAYGVPGIVRMSSQTAQSHSGWSGRGRVADSNTGWEPTTPTSPGWSSPVTRISTGPFIGYRCSTRYSATFDRYSSVNSWITRWTSLRRQTIA